jgi:hypothetical protein
MAHYAFITDGIVTEVITGIDENELIEGQSTEDWYSQFKGQTCLRTSYNGKIRYNYAGIGYTYDAVDDAFIAPMPECSHDSLFLNTKKKWECASCEADTLQSRTTA